MLQQARSLYSQALVADESEQNPLWSKTLMQIRKAEGLIDDSITANLQSEFKLLKTDVESNNAASERARQQKKKDDMLCEVIQTSILDSFFQNQGMWFGEQPDFLQRLEDAFGDYGIRIFDEIDPLVKTIHESRISDELLKGLHHWQSQ